VKGRKSAPKIVQKGGEGGGLISVGKRTKKRNRRGERERGPTSYGRGLHRKRSGERKESHCAGGGIKTCTQYKPGKGKKVQKGKKKGRSLYNEGWGDLDFTPIDTKKGGEGKKMTLQNEKKKQQRSF